MKKYLLLFLLVVCSVSAHSQENSLVDNYSIVSQENDSTWQVREFNVYEYTIVYQANEYTFMDTVLVLGGTLYLDSTGIVSHLFTKNTNEQNRQSAAIARAFDAVTTRRNVVDANTLINAITNNASNYFEEAAKEFRNVLPGQYRVFYDSLGVQKNQLATLELVTTVAHPDGRSMRLVLASGVTYTVQVFHRWSWRIVGWPFGNEYYVWDRKNTDRPLYRPTTYASRTETFARIIKLN